MTLHELKAYRLALRDKLQQLERITPNCRSCAHMDAGRCTRHCAAPPPEFQREPEACADWQYDHIPF